MLLMNSLSETDWLSKPHSLSEATNSLSGCKILERISSLNGFSLTLAQRDMLAERAFVWSLSIAFAR
ncbi:hypothetical protein glysoja_026778 [Glycine soja]|uniref:Uncharacterized protein n=1 Tax=Glycine soja TaxID=3848 RepID=A0A0B2QMY0_GLYSO|nr:hypothetical protein glysoja_026778 [Glycine soja]